MKEAVFKPIGIIHTPFERKEDIPPLSEGGRDAVGWAEVLPEYAPGLKDLDGFSHIVLVFHLHLCTEYALHVIPYRDDQLRGLFATRSPRRPNPIGITVVKLERLEGNIIHFRGVDMLDGSPLLDIKPYAPHSNPTGDVRIGWLEGRV